MTYEFTTTTHPTKPGKTGTIKSPDGKGWTLRETALSAGKVTCLWFRTKREPKRWRRRSLK